jgi:membrane-bound lytic murein transglycosylase MltF
LFILHKTLLKIALPLMVLISLLAMCQNTGTHIKPENIFQDEVSIERKPALNKWAHIEELETLRVLVSPSRTNFFLGKGKARGLEYDLFEQWELDLRKSLNKKNFQVIYIPVSHNQLLSSLMQGHGDVAAAMLTITPEREKIVDFTAPYLTGVSEVLVQHKKAPPIKSLEDLSGKKIFVADGSSYLSSLIKLNSSLESSSLAPVKITTLKKLNTEDILELLNTGLFDYSFADHTLAELWSGVLPQVQVIKDIRIGSHKNIAWAIRKDSPQLKDKLDAFAHKNRKGSLLGNILFKRYYQKPYWLDQSLLSSLGGLGELKTYFQEAGEKYELDWLYLAMQCFQESSFKADAKSSAGAIGLMQLLPSTAKDMGVEDLYDPQQSIMGGAKYMSWIKSHYFKGLEGDNKLFFCLAAYNAGFRRVQNWRKDATAMGYNPDIWFGNVEHVAFHKTGLEPVRYVSNIHKAFTAMSQYFKIAEEKKVLIKEAKIELKK